MTSVWVDIGRLQCTKNGELIVVFADPSVVGRHCIYDLQGGDPHLLDNEDFIKAALIDAAKAANATLLEVSSRKFEPQGITALALLSESHISIHTWPEFGYAAIDAFTCGDKTQPKAACDSLRIALKSTYGSMQLLTRSCPDVSLLRLQGVVL